MRFWVLAIGHTIPLFVFQEFLAHENLRYAGRGQQQSGGDTAAASRVPRSVVGRIGKRGDTLLTPDENQIVIFHAGHRSPGMIEAWRV